MTSGDVLDERGDLGDLVPSQAQVHGHAVPREQAYACDELRQAGEPSGLVLQEPAHAGDERDVSQVGEPGGGGCRILQCDVGDDRDDRRAARRHVLDPRRLARGLRG